LRQFYISDPRMFELKMSDFDFKLYSYLCKNYDLKRLTSFVRMIDCADHMIVPLDKIKAALQRLSLCVRRYLYQQHKCRWLHVVDLHCDSDSARNTAALHQDQTMPSLVAASQISLGL